MLNEFTYCTRLGYLEWVQGEFADNDETVEGRYHHRNVDRVRQRGRRDEGDADAPKIHERSVWLGSEALGLSAKIDLLEGQGVASRRWTTSGGSDLTPRAAPTSPSWSSCARRVCC